MISNTKRQFSSSNRQAKRRHIRIQSLPHKRHALAQSILIKRPTAHFGAESLHRALERRGGCLSLLVHAGKHIRVVELVEQCAVCADERWTSKFGTECKLLKDLGKGREVVHDIDDALGSWEVFVQGRRMEGKGGGDGEELVGVDCVVGGGD
jgi:hypothetical protein